MDKIKIERTWLQGSPVQVDNLMGNAFVGEAGAHEFLISGKDNAGNVVPITGTITGKFLSSTMTTFALSGYVAEGVASVTLPSECYGAPGQFVVSIFATNGSTTTCIYCGVGSIFRTSTAAIAYPTTTLPDLTLLINQLDDVIASFPADLSHLLGAIAPTFVDNLPFYAGQYVWHDQVLYRFTVDHPAGSWAGSADTVVAVIGTELNSTVRYTQQVLTDAQKTVARTNIDAADADDVTDLELTTVQVTPQTFDDNSKSQARSNIGAASSGDLNALSTIVNNQGGYISDLNASIGTVPTGETVEGQISDLKSALNELLFVEDCPFVRELYINDAGITGNVEKLHAVYPDGQTVGKIQFSNAAGSSVTALCLPVTSASLLSYKPIPIYSATDTRTIFGYILFDWSYFTEYTVISKQINEIAYKPEFSPSIKEYLQKDNVDSIKSSVASTNEFIAELGYTQEIDINYESRKLPNPDGSFYTDNGSTQTFFGSGYIRIPQGAERVKYLGIGYSSTVVTPIAFYTEDFTFISAVPVTSFKIYEGIVSIPSNAVYFYQSKYEKAGDSRTSDNYTFFLFGEEKVSIDSLSGVGYPTKVYNADAFTKTDVPKTDGTSYTATGWYATDFIYCKGSESVDYNVYAFPSIAAVAFYDSSKTLIDYVTDSLGHMITGRVAVPSNAEYVRGTNANNNPAYIKVNACGLYIAKEQVPLTQGMKICCVGDSLTKGVDVGSHVIKESYPYFMSQYLDCFVVNYGHPGVSAKGWWNSDHLTKTFDSNMDVVLIMFGTNGGLAINTLATDVEPYDDWEDYADTECGCYCKLIESIMEQTQNHAQIILMTPPYSTYSEGQTQTVIATAPVIRAIAQRYCLPVIDVLYESGMNAFNGNVFRPHDGCHFNAKGYHRLGTFVGSKIKSMVSTFDINESYADETPTT